MRIETFSLGDVKNSDGSPSTIETRPGFDNSVVPPPTQMLPDYILRDEAGEPITDENNEDVTVEGLKSA